MNACDTEKIENILAQLKNAGVEIFENFGKLKYRCSAGAYTPALRELVKTHRIGIIAHVASQPPPPARQQPSSPPAAFRFAPDQAIRWPTAAGDFVLLLAPDDLPPAPFQFEPWAVIVDPTKFLRALRANILAGPGGPRNFYGAVAGDVRRLRDLVIETEGKS
jgi:hypothetical protein